MIIKLSRLLFMIRLSKSIYKPLWRFFGMLCGNARHIISPLGKNQEEIEGIANDNAYANIDK